MSYNGPLDLPIETMSEQYGDFDQPYHVAVTCRASSIPRCASNLPNDSKVPAYAEPYRGTDTTGYFIDHADPDRVIRARHAGFARF